MRDELRVRYRIDGVLTTVDTEAEHQRLAREGYAEAGIATQRARTIAGAALVIVGLSAADARRESRAAVIGEWRAEGLVGADVFIGVSATPTGNPLDIVEDVRARLEASA